MRTPFPSEILPVIGAAPVGLPATAPIAERQQPVALPQTGAGEGDTGPAGGCCGGPAPTGVDACCVKDADSKASGEAGCGCGSQPTDLPAAPPAAATGACCGG